MALTKYSILGKETYKQKQKENPTYLKHSAGSFMDDQHTILEQGEKICTAIKAAAELVIATWKWLRPHDIRISFDDKNSDKSPTYNISCDLFPFFPLFHICASNTLLPFWGRPIHNFCPVWASVTLRLCPNTVNSSWNILANDYCTLNYPTPTVAQKSTHGLFERVKWEMESLGQSHRPDCYAFEILCYDLRWEPP